MAAVVKLDILNGAAASHHILNGWSITRVATVTGLNTAGADNSPQLYQEALTAVIAITGDRGSACPNITPPTYLEEFIPELLSASAVRIRIVYRGHPSASYEFDGCLTQVDANVDRLGDPITTEYTYPATYTPDPKKAGKTVVQGGLVQRPVPEPTFTVKFLVTANMAPLVLNMAPSPMSLGLFLPGMSAPSIFAGLTATEYMTVLGFMNGRVNRKPYTIGVIRGLKHQWMIKNVRGSSSDGGVTYTAEMTFQYREASWDPQVTFINPDDGKPPSDLVKGTGYKLVEVPLECDFPTFIFSSN